MPVGAGNRAISNGTIGNLMQGAAQRRSRTQCT